MQVSFYCLFYYLFMFTKMIWILGSRGLVDDPACYFAQSKFHILIVLHFFFLNFNFFSLIWIHVFLLLMLLGAI